MSYASSQPIHQPMQLWTFAAVMFGAIVAAITASTVIIMSLMQGQIAAALSQPAFAPQTNQSGAVVTACAQPEVVGSEDTTPVNTSAALAATDDWMGERHFKPASAVHNSFNTTNTTSNTSTTTSEWTDKSVHIENVDDSKIKVAVDSFNTEDSFNKTKEVDVTKTYTDNTDNSTNVNNDDGEVNVNSPLSSNELEVPLVPFPYL